MENTSLRTIAFLALCLLRALPAAAAPFAYVPNSDDGTVSVIDTATDTVVATVPVGQAPIGVAVHPAGTYAYVTNRGDGSLSVIDTRTNAVSATLSVGADGGVAVHPDGRSVYLTAGRGVSVLDTATNQVIRSIPYGPGRSGFGDRDIVVSPDGEQLFALLTSDNEACLASIFGCRLRVFVIDILSGSGGAFGREQNEIGAYPKGIAVNAAGTDLFVVNRTFFSQDVGETDVVSAIPVSAGALLKFSIPLADGGFGVVLDPSGQRLYATAGRDRGMEAGSVVVIDTVANRIVNTVLVGVSPRGVAVNPAGTRVYVTNTGDDTVSVIDTASETVIDTIRVGGGPMALGQFIGPELATATATSTPTPSPTSTRIPSPTGMQTVAQQNGSGGGCSAAPVGSSGSQVAALFVLLPALLRRRKR